MMACIQVPLLNIVWEPICVSKRLRQSELLPKWHHLHTSKWRLRLTSTGLNCNRIGLSVGKNSCLLAAVLELDSINESTGFSQRGIGGGNFLSNFPVTFDFQSVTTGS